LAGGFSKGTPDSESRPKLLLLFFAGPNSDTFEASEKLFKQDGMLAEERLGREISVQCIIEIPYC
jgi:hypothetical protein